MSRSGVFSYEERGMHQSTRPKKSKNPKRGSKPGVLFGVPGSDEGRGYKNDDLSVDVTEEENMAIWTALISAIADPIWGEMIR